MTKIIQRHDTAANWASANPVLAQGEMGIEDDTRKFKFGDGATAWADLPYASSEGGGGGGTSNYNDLINKPTINGFEVVGNINPSKVNIQPLLTPKSGIEVKQDGDWHILDGSYDKATKVITFNKYDLRRTTAVGQFTYYLGQSNSIGGYIDSSMLKPTAGLIISFYKNITLKVANYIYDVVILGNYDGVNFTPRVWISLENSASSANIARINSIAKNSNQIFTCNTMSTTLTSASTTVSSDSGAYFPYLTILYENNTYTFKSGWGNSSQTGTSRYVKIQTTQASIFNECTHMWFIPKVQTMGLGQSVKLMSGDKSLALTRRELTEEEQNASLMSPDDTDKEYYTSISVKTDGVTTKINESGALEAIPPSNMITSENIASDATIVGMNNAIEMAQGDITTLNETVLPTKTNKVQAAQASMPSSNSMDLTIGSSGTSYTAPANGWFSLDVWTTSTSVSYIGLYNNTTKLGWIAVPNQESGYQQRLFIPARTGDNVILSYSNLDNNKQKVFKFIYAEGEV